MKPTYSYTLLAAPDEPVITLEQVWAQLRLDPEGSPSSTPADALLEAYIAAAISHVDGPSGNLGRCLVSQKWRVTIGCWPNGRALVLPLPRLISVDAVTYLDASGDEQPIDPANYRVIDGEPGSVLLNAGGTWPTTNGDPDAVRIDITAGWETAEEVPQAIKQALLLLVAHWHENREPVAFSQPVQLPFAVDALLATHRYYGNR